MHTGLDVFMHRLECKNLRVRPRGMVRENPRSTQAVWFMRTPGPPGFAHTVWSMRTPGVAKVAFQRPPKEKPDREHSFKLRKWNR